MKQLLIIISILGLGLNYSLAQQEDWEVAPDGSNEIRNIESSTAPQKVSPTIVSDIPPSKLEKLQAQQRQMEEETNKQTLERLTETRIKSELELSKKVEESLNNRLNNVDSPSAANLDSPVQHQYEEISKEKFINQQVTINQNLDDELEREAQIAHEALYALPISSLSPKYYMAGLAGILDYSRSNVQSKPGVGLIIGGDANEIFSVEAMFFYSRHLIDIDEHQRRSRHSYRRNIYQEVDQFNIGATGKFSVLKNSSLISPYIGGTVNLTLRKYTEITVRHQGRQVRVIDLGNDDTSQAFDAGISAGVDIHLPQSFSIGLDWKYMVNAYQHSDFDFGQYFHNQDRGATMEEAGYHLLSASAKFRF